MTSYHSLDTTAILEAIANEIKNLKIRVRSLENTEIIPGKIKDPSGTTTHGLTSSSLCTTACGSIGINTTSPSNTLTVNASTFFAIPALGANGGQLGLLVGNAYGAIMGVAGTGNVFLQAQRVDGTTTAYDILCQPNGGYVHIGGSGTPASMLGVTGSVYVSNTVSASVFTDRTPYPDLATASRAIYSIMAKKECSEIDHEKLDPFIKSPDGGRDIGALLSALTLVVQEQQKQIEELKKERG